MPIQLKNAIAAILFIFGAVIVTIYTTATLNLDKIRCYHQVTCQSSWYITEFKDTILLNQLVNRENFYGKDSIVKISPIKEEFKPFKISKREADIFFE